MVKVVFASMVYTNIQNCFSVSPLTFSSISFCYTSIKGCLSIVKEITDTCLNVLHQSLFHVHTLQLLCVVKAFNNLVLRTKLVFDIRCSPICENIERKTTS